MSPEPTELTEAELAIHVAICEGSPEDCKDWRGRCVKAAEAVRPILAAEALEDMAIRLEEMHFVKGERAWPFVAEIRKTAAALRTTTPEKENR